MLNKGGQAPPADGDFAVKYLIRIAMMGLSLATITPVARGATLGSSSAAYLAGTAGALR